MPDGNGFAEYKKLFEEQHKQTRGDIQRLSEKFDAFTDRCNARFTATEVETAKVKATIKERAQFYGLIAGSLPAIVWLIIQVLTK